MNLRPIKNRVLIELEQAKPVGLIFTPEDFRPKPLVGTIMDLGPAATAAILKLHPDDNCVGRRVLCGPNAGTEILIEGKRHLIVDAKEVLAVVW